MTLDLTEDEAAALAVHLRHALDYDPFPHTLQVASRAMLAKLEGAARRR